MRKVETKKYYKALRKSLRHTHSPKQADEIISMLQSSANDFFEDNPEASFQDFLEQFGDIEELHYSFLEDAQDLSKQVQRAHFRKMLYIAISIIVILAGAIYGGYLINGYLESRETIIKYERTIIY